MDGTRVDRRDGMNGSAKGGGELRDGFKFRSDHLALDLAATVAGRRGEPRDLLATPADLDRWLIAAGLGDGLPGASDADLAAARELREALYRLALARMGGQPFAAADLDVVNRWAAERSAWPRLAVDGTLHWSGGGVPALLARVAREGVELLGGPMAERIRRCSGEGCAILFVDSSRSGERRWCSMAGCGNRAKVAEFRRRSRGPGADAERG